MAKVTLDHVSKTFYRAKQAAVGDLSLTVADGEFLVIVGPSGCGKSTTLRLIAGLEQVSQGTIAFDDAIINDVPPKNRDVAMVFQNYALYPHLSAAANISFGLKLRKYPKPEIRRRVHETANLLGLSGEMLDRKPRELSGGQRQRVALGRAIVRQPRVFLLDEPLSNLDVTTRAHLRADITKLQRHLRTTMIYVTHDQIEAMTMGDRMAVMSRGRLQQVGTPREIYHRPANLFVAGFVGTPPINLIEGEIIHHEGHTCFHELGPLANPGSCLFRLTPDQSTGLSAHINQRVVLGIRSEDFQIVTPEHPSPTKPLIHTTLETVESIGAATDLQATTSLHPITVRTLTSHSYQPGQNLELAIHLEKVHFFEYADPNSFKQGRPRSFDREAWQSACQRIG